MLNSPIDNCFVSSTFAVIRHTQKSTLKSMNSTLTLFSFLFIILVLFSLRQPYGCHGVREVYQALADSVPAFSSQKAAAKLLIFSFPSKLYSKQSSGRNLIIPNRPLGFAGILSF